MLSFMSECLCLVKGMTKMDDIKQNYYGSLCTELYEILHEKAPQDELDFFLSYAKKGQKILEPLCGSGRFYVPFSKAGYDISGVDLSGEMLEKLRQKISGAKVVQADLTEFVSEDRYDYIFIPSGSLSLFTDIYICKKILGKLKELLTPGGKLVFAVETIADQCADDEEYRMTVSVKTKEGFDLILKTRNHYEQESQTQFSPGIYELYNGKELLQREFMDFQTHLYVLGEMEGYLRDVGFTKIITYSAFDKKIATDNQSEMFLYECS